MVGAGTATVVGVVGTGAGGAGVEAADVERAGVERAGTTVAGIEVEAIDVEAGAEFSIVLPAAKVVIPTCPLHVLVGEQHLPAPPLTIMHCSPGSQNFPCESQQDEPGGIHPMPHTI